MAESCFCQNGLKHGSGFKLLMAETCQPHNTDIVLKTHKTAAEATVKYCRKYNSQGSRQKIINNKKQTRSAFTTMQSALSRLYAEI